MPRTPLDRDRIVEAAVAVADAGGLRAVSMRQVGRELGVEAMSLYHHLDGKEDLLDALADWIFTGIDVPDPEVPWRRAMTERAASARRVLGTHPWALGLIESRAPGPALLRHHDRVLGSLRGNGFTVALAAEAFSVLDSYVYGFVLTERNIPVETGEPVDALAAEALAAIDPTTYPHLVELMSQRHTGTGYSYADEFEGGLTLILDGLEARLGSEP